MNGSKFEKNQSWSLLENNVIHVIEKYHNKTYLFTRKNGGYISENRVLKPWESPLKSILKAANINVEIK